MGTSLAFATPGVTGQEMLYRLRAPTRVGDAHQFRRPTAPCLAPCGSCTPLQPGSPQAASVGSATAHSPLPAAASVRTGLRVRPCRTCQMSTDSSTPSLVVIPRRSCHRDLFQRAFVNVKYCSLFLYRNGRTTEGCRLACS